MSNNNRKRIILSIEIEFEALQGIDNGESIKKIVEDLTVGAVAVPNWRMK